MLETYVNLPFQRALCYESSEFLSLYTPDELCCPQPRRPASPVLGRSSQRKRRSLTSVKVELEASQEIQQILFSQVFGDVESESGVDSPTLNHSTPSLEDSGEMTNKMEGFGLYNFLPHHLVSPLAVRKNASLRKKPRLGASHSRVDVPEPVPTPPVRAHNPLPRNSPFVNRRTVAQDGAEFGLLSVSPPPCAEDDDLCVRRNRVKGWTASTVGSSGHKPHYTQDEDVFGYPYEVDVSF